MGKENILIVYFPVLGLYNKNHKEARGCIIVVMAAESCPVFVPNGKMCYDTGRKNGIYSRLRGHEKDGIKG
ncbi:MAG: hypothetical protein NC347_11520 [Clostridium sp.]|nr:hypothetical protein [Clostridium sp.]